MSVERERSPGFSLDGIAVDEPIMAYWMSGGECSSPCEFRIEVFADGRVDHRAYGNVLFSSEIDADALIAQIATLSLDDLIVDSDDCARDADGNAPTLEIGRVAIDTCFDVLDSTNEVVQLASSLEDRIRAQVPLVDYYTLDELRAAAVRPTVDPNATTAWPSKIIPGSCESAYTVNPASTDETSALAISTFALAIEQSGDFCNIWIIDNEGNEDLCPIPRSWSGHVLVGESWFRCPGT